MSDHMLQEKRLVRLEENAYYQKELVDALNDALVQQQAQIDVLQCTVARLEEQILELSDMGEGAANTPPPHYQSRG